VVAALTGTPAALVMQALMVIRVIPAQVVAEPIRVAADHPVAQVLTGIRGILALRAMVPRLVARALRVVQVPTAIRARLALPVQVQPMVPQARREMPEPTEIRAIQVMLALARLLGALDHPVTRVLMAPEATLVTMARARLRVAQDLRAMLGPTAMLEPQALRAQGPPMAGRDLRAALAQPVITEQARQMATLAPPVTPGMFHHLATTSQCPEAQAAMAEMPVPAIMA